MPRPRRRGLVGPQLWPATRVARERDRRRARSSTTGGKHDAGGRAGLERRRAQALTDYLARRLQAGGGRWQFGLRRPYLRRPVDERPRRELGHDRRPQADRDPLHLDEPRSSSSSAAAWRELMRAQLATPNEDFIVRNSYNELLTMHGTIDGLPGRRPGLGRVRQLPGPADDRGARHGVPAAERVLVLDVPARRRRAARRASSRRAAPAHTGWYGYPPLSDAGARPRPGPLDPRPAHPHALVARRRDQLHRDDPQHAHRRHDVDAAAALRLGDRDLRVAARRRAARALGRADAAAARPPGRDALLHPAGGRERRSSTSTSSGSSGTPRSTS